MDKELLAFFEEADKEELLVAQKAIEIKRAKKIENIELPSGINKKGKVVDIEFRTGVIRSKILNKICQKKDLPREILSLEMRMQYGKPEENLESEERMRFVSLEELDIGIDNIEYQNENFDYRYEALIRTWKKLQKYVDDKLTIRIWIRDLAEDYCGLFYLAHYLENKSVPVEVVYIPFEKDDDSSREYPGKKELEEGFINRKNLSMEEIHAFSQEWNRIEREGKHLRILKDGKIISKGSTEYDYMVDYYVGTEPTRAIKILRMIMEEQSILRLWLIYRIKHFVKEGKIEITGYFVTEHGSRQALLKKNSNLVDIVFYNDKLKELYEQKWKDANTESFSTMLLRLIQKNGMKDSEVYKKANIDRRHFSKIRTDEHYMPSKRAVVLFALAMQLSLDETNALLYSAGFTFSDAFLSDLIIKDCIRRKNYDIHQINQHLISCGLASLI